MKILFGLKIIKLTAAHENKAIGPARSLVLQMSDNVPPTIVVPKMRNEYEMI